MVSSVERAQLRIRWNGDHLIACPSKTDLKRLFTVLNIWNAHSQFRPICYKEISQNSQTEIRSFNVILHGNKQQSVLSLILNLCCHRVCGWFRSGWCTGGDSEVVLYMNCSLAPARGWIGRKYRIFRSSVWPDRELNPVYQQLVTRGQPTRPFSRSIL